MKFSNRKARQTVAKLDKFFDIEDQSLLVFEEGVRNYLHRNTAAVSESLQTMVKLENEAIQLQRNIEESLYRNEIYMNSDVLRLLERMQHIVDMLSKDLFQFDIERPNVPAELNSDFLKLMNLSTRAVATTIPAAKTFFRSPEAVPDKVRRVYFYQKEADRESKALKRKVFHEMDSLKLSEKVHLRYFALHIEELALQASKVADQLSVMYIRYQSLSSRAWTKWFLPALEIVAVAMMVVAPVMLIGRGHFGFSDKGFGLVAALSVLSLLLLSVLIIYVMRNRRAQRDSSRRFSAQEDEINNSNRKLSEMEVQITKMENDHLQNLLELKRRETTGVVEKITEQRQFIDTIYDGILQAESTSDNAEREKLLHDLKVQLGLRRNATGEKNDFYAQVEQLHQDFSVRLAAKFPELTAQERKLATLLRLDFSTKYIAGLLNISPKSVEIERHRMRTKMGLSRDVKLTDFIKSI
ncbi:MAG: DUF47 family protein [Bacteroidales bacterium]|nr:DUF47 family protein [Bacteroidales bacterium]